MPQGTGYARLLLRVALLFSFSALRVGAVAAEGTQAPFELRVEYLVNPIGIDARIPRFSWVPAHTARGESQTAYQILVGTTLKGSEEDRGEMWDSGKVASAQSSQVLYAGQPLQSRRGYFWEVRYWDTQGRPSPYSHPARFEMGLLLEAGDWQARWVGGGNQMRKEFQVAGTVERARLYVTALGYYEVSLNGQRVGHRVLDPAWTTYPKRVLYSTYDVTTLVRRGANAVGTMLGGGWATQSPRPYYDAPALLLQLEIELEGGKLLRVASDGSWKVRQGPVLSDGIYDGEVYDATREAPGWDRAGFDDSGWKAAAVVEGSKGVLSAQMMPPIRVVDSLTPKSMRNPRPGVYVYDFGQNFAGWALLRVNGPRGARVQMRFSELLDSNGMLNTQNLRTAKARDVYILRGGGPEVYEPRFTYHGFRYVELTGYTGTPSLDSVRGRVVHSDVAAIGNFSSSNEILNGIQRLIHWGQLSNLYSIPTDCDQRNERMGWMGDAHVTTEEAMMNFDMAAFYANFIRDIRDIQGDDGSVTDTVPHKYGQRPADPAWGTAYPLLCWYMWRQYGDRRILEENYEGLKKYVGFLNSRASGHVLRYSYYGDWVAVEPTPGELVSDAYYYYDTWILSEIARVLGRAADAASYSELASQIKDAFHRAFYNEANGAYANGSQSAQTLPLFFGMVPDKERGKAFSRLVNDIVYGHDTHLTTGFIGVKYLLPLLSATGRADLAYELAAQTSYPSWGYMLTHGATTLWELWQNKTGPSMNSHNHPMFGSLGAWFYQALGGIQVDREADGGSIIRIEPQIVEDLYWASASVETLGGRVACSWRRDPEGISLDVEVPTNSNASVLVPFEPRMTDVRVQENGQPVWEKGHYVDGVAGIRSAGQQSGGIRIEIGSGHYSFRLAGE